ncbi:hypothetical protein AVEN_205141-1 [Araneus ventricosus]|uniref:Uncharacterized protein n=1 Tax=Araneus ventricosus TaxID=182803 RepID=A0A4Y2IT49_ARAVE|nr:hypothetical protein AVEN_205141-1 [Araneus ventricosus]
MPVPQFGAMLPINEHAEDEIRQLQKMIQSLENDLDRVQADLTQSNVVLEEKDKLLHACSAPYCHHLNVMLIIQYPPPDIGNSFCLVVRMFGWGPKGPHSSTPKQMKQVL